MPSVTVPAWSTPVVDIEKRLKKLESVLQGAKKPDGTIDMVKAKAAAGTDVRTADLLQSVRLNPGMPSLTEAQSRRAFLDLQTAVATAADFDRNKDGSVTFRELPMFYDDSDPVKRLMFRAAKPLETRNGEDPSPRVQLSREARQEAERIITETARFHAQTPQGAEAMAWEMRMRITEGYDIKDPIVFDAANFSESNWKAKLPFFGEKYRGQGHLSDKELEKRFGNLSDYVARAKETVNTRLLLDYQTEYLAGKDLP
jgi:hypothetical protein